ncbi:glycoside hydrolase family 36 protein [Paenibacillus spongiae]|uniref:Alpha-galactosidase n=1 Tax=Paenibacillus spongiae TaxID=2909671 RepID=A0ABY5S9J2_9BACL|nr:glycoside hydrolase family 36 protein [Paenibacillus spongiae]UVI30607.1 alpha-galactosidase [Paenibacillus spongiae]
MQTIKTEFMTAADSFVRQADGQMSKQAVVKSDWQGEEIFFRVWNEGDQPVTVKELVLFKGAWPFTADTRFYGEGYSKLSQYGGTIGEPRMIGGYDDRKHYKMPATDGFFTAYHFVLLSPGSEEEGYLLLGFTSCKRFTGEIRLADGHFEIVLDGEQLVLEPGQSWELESFAIDFDQEREALLERYAAAIKQHHPMLPTASIPNGWCSWYCFGPEVTEQNIFDNMEAIAKQVPQLKYIQIDDGYQAYMGDWLSPGASFSDMQALCQQIKRAGFEPAIWVAPFIAQAESAVFREHPDWFIQDDNGQPLASNAITFGGWRNGPWYMLDGTHPGAQNYLRHVFRTMREEWGSHYFKLDANMWGAIPGGRRFDPKASKVEAYRRGMAAVLEGAGEDSFLLGCNAPMWPSLGTVHGMRVTNDIERHWSSVTGLAYEGFHRNWQHNRLWVNDPDCLVLENKVISVVNPDGTIRQTSTPLSEDEFQFHAAYVVATGGMVLSGDDLAAISANKLEMLKKAASTRNIAAKFEDDRFIIGVVSEPERTLYCLFNWGDEPQTLTIQLTQPGRMEDFWSGQQLGQYQGPFTLDGMAPHSARIIACYPST